MFLYPHYHLEMLFVWSEHMSATVYYNLCCHCFIDSFYAGQREKQA